MKNQASFTRKTYDFYKALKARGPVPFSLDELRAALMDVLANRPHCPYCNSVLTVAKVSLDHILPVSRGGTNDLSNIQFICKSDNKAKGDWTDAEYQDTLKVMDKLGKKHRNPNMRKRVVDALRISQSFRQGRAWRAKKARAL